MLLAAQFSLVALGLFLRHGPPQIPPSAARAPAARGLAHAPLTVQKCGDTFTKIKALTEGRFVPQTV